MTLSPQLKAINCTACGAGLDLLGGGRVTTHICPYCGTELDARDDYKALRKHSDMTRPETPFRLGMTGKAMGVDWTIIGTLGHLETWGGRHWVWVEHQLYSPTHGYAWLTVEDGHLVFSRRLRGAPGSLWMSERAVETSDTPPRIWHAEERFKYLQTTKSRLTFAEGEFTWSPGIGDRTTTISAMSEKHLLDFSATGREREIYKSTYLPHDETCRAFGLDPKDLPTNGVHALQPFRGNEALDFVAYVSALAAAASLILAITFAALPGRIALDSTRVGIATLPRTLSFEITDASKLAGVKLRADMSNAWAYYDIELTDPEDRPVFEAGRTVEYYQGVEGGERWSEGNRSASIYFRPPMAGRYSLTIDQAEDGTWGSSGIRKASEIMVSARENLSSGYYLFWLAAGFALLALLTGGRKFLHRKRRWNHSDWDDD